MRSIRTCWPPVTASIDFWRSASQAFGSSTRSGAAESSISLPSTCQNSSRLARLASFSAQPPVSAPSRSASAPAAATLFALPEGGAEVVLDEPQFGVSPGQAAVCYDGSRVLGGGWIAAAESRLAA